MDDRATLKAAGFSDAEIDAYLLSQRAPAQPLTTAPDGPYAQSRGVPMENAMLPSPRTSSAINTGVAGVNQLLRGFTGGLSDAAGAGIGSLLTGTPYRQIRENQDYANTRFANEHPIANVGLNVAGGLIPGSPLAKIVGKASGMVRAAPAGAGIMRAAANTIGRGVVGGAVGGGVSGIGYQQPNDTFGETLMNGVRGVAGGAALGGAASALTPVVSKLGSVTADISGLRQLSRGTPSGMVPRAPGTGSMLERAGDAVEGVLYPAQVSRTADRKVLGAVTDLGKKSMNRVRTDQRFDNMMSNNEALVADQGDDLVKRLVRGANIKNPEASQEIGMAFKARDKRLLSNINDDISRTVSGKTNTVRAGKAFKAQAENASTPLYDATRNEAVTLSTDSRGVLLDRDPRGIFRAAHRVARDLAAEEGQTIPPLFSRLDDGTRVLTRDKMTVQEIDYMKRGIQELANTGTKSGKTISKMRARNMLKNMKPLLDDADTQVPDYARARMEFQAPMVKRDAMNTALKGGKQYGAKESVPSFKTGSPDELGEYAQNLPTDEAKDAYDIGKGASMYRDAARNPRKFTRDLNNADMQARLQRTTQPRDMGRTKELLGIGEVRDAQTRRMNDVMSQSKTPEGMTDAASSDLVGNLGQWVYAAPRAAGRLIAGQSLVGLQGKTSGEIANRMALKGPVSEEYLAYLQQLQKSDARLGVSRGNAGRTALATLLGMGMR